MLIALALISLTVVTQPARAQQQDARPLPGVGPHDPRVRADPDAGPWRAVGKLQATSGPLHESCTGSLIGPALVLTAAHCVYNPRTRHNFLPESLHFLIGFHGDDYAGHAIGTHLVTGPGFDPLHPDEARGSDWALLTLDTRLGTPDRMLALADQSPSVGAQIMLGGYNQDHSLQLMVDRNCRIIGQMVDRGGRALLVDDCAATRGVSGAPVLVADGKGWRVAGVLVAAAMSGQTGLVVPLGAVRAELGRAGKRQ
jgi:protease YdgD